MNPLDLVEIIVIFITQGTFQIYDFEPTFFVYQVRLSAQIPKNNVMKGARDVGLWEVVFGAVAECIRLYFMIDWGASQEVDLAGHC